MQQPRQLYGLGSLVKSVKKAVKKVVKSPVGKAAILGFGGAGLMGMGPLSGLAGLLPAKGTGKFLFSPVQGSGGGGLFGKILGSKKAVTGLIGGASLLSGLFAGKTEEEVEQLKRDPTALRNYLKLYYSNLNPNASSEEVDRFADANMYSDGGRVGYDDGGSAYDRLEEKIKELMDQGLSRELAEALAESGLSKEAYTIPEKKSAGGRVGYAVGSPGPASPRAVPAGGPGAKTVAQLGSSQGSSPLFNQVLQYLSRPTSTPTAKPTSTPAPLPASAPAAPTSPPKFDYGQGAILGGGIEDTRSIALQNLSDLGYNVDRFIDKSSIPSMSMSSGPQLVGPGGMMPNMKFKDEATLSKLLNPQIGSLQTDLISVLREAKDIGRNYTIDQALKLTEKDILEISDLYNRKNKLGPYQPRQRSTYTGPTDFRMVGGVAVPKAEGGRVGYADGSDFSKDRQYKLWEKRYKKNPESILVTEHEKFKEYKEFYDRQNKAMGGNIVDQASGIMGLPKRVNKAGIKELDLRKSGGFIPPVGVKENADDIPAMLSNNEFVFTADAVRGMGNGNVNLGAQRMYDMMKKLEKGGRV